MWSCNIARLCCNTVSIDCILLNGGKREGVEGGLGRSNTWVALCDTNEFCEHALLISASSPAGTYEALSNVNWWEVWEGSGTDTDTDTH